jgi:hypothetical protein
MLEEEELWADFVVAIDGMVLPAVLLDERKLWSDFVVEGGKDFPAILSDKEELWNRIYWNCGTGSIRTVREYRFTNDSPV